MARSKERICSACGAKYNYCPRCDADANKPRWMFAFHSQNCKDLYTVATDYFGGELSKEAALEKLNTLDLSYRDNLHPSIQKALDEILPIEEEERDILSFLKK